MFRHSNYAQGAQQVNFTKKRAHDGTEAAYNRGSTFDLPLG